MKRVKGVEDLNILMIGAQGILGVGVITRTFTASFPLEAFPQTVSDGSIPATLSSCR